MYDDVNELLENEFVLYLEDIHNCETAEEVLLACRAHEQALFELLLPFIKKHEGTKH